MAVSLGGGTAFFMCCSKCFHVCKVSTVPVYKKRKRLVISGKARIRKYSSPQKELPLEVSLLKRLSSEGETEMANRSKESYREENAQLKKRIKELEKSLSFSRLETEARDLMITRAEEYFNIQIRKKSGAK